MSNERKFKIQVTEDELKALIDHNLLKLQSYGYTVETSARIHDLTKRLNRETPEIEEVIPTEAKGSTW